jgi:hypothetical protein
MTDATDGMLLWKQQVLDKCELEPYSDEWWQAMTDSLTFLPEEMREAIMAAIVGVGAAM